MSDRVSGGVGSVPPVRQSADRVGPGSALPSWLTRITDAELERWAGRGAVGRGRDYALDGAVLSLTVASHGDVVLAEVSGTRGSPYSTMVTFVGDTGRGPQWVSRCSCPVGTKCKHAVALVLHARSQAPVAGQTWSDVLGGILVDAPVPEIGSSSRLGLGVVVDTRPRSVTDTTPVNTVVLVPRKESRIGSWITTIGWSEIIAPLGTSGVRAGHTDIARRLSDLAARATTPVLRLETPRAIEIRRLGLGVWGLLAAAQRAGVELQTRNPAETVELGSPVDIVADVRAASGGGARVSFAVAGHSAASLIVPIADSRVHGLYLERASGAAVLAPVRVPVPAWIGDLLADRTVLEVPGTDLEDFVTDWIPRLCDLVDVRDPDGVAAEFTTQAGAEPAVTGPFLHLLFEGPADLEGEGPLNVDVHASIAYLVGGQVERFELSSGWDAMRNYPAEDELVDALDLLDEVPGLVVHERYGSRLVRPHITLTGMDMVRVLTAVLPALQAHPDLIVDLGADLPSFEKGGEAEVEVTALDEVRDWLSLRVTVTVDGEEVPFADLFAALVRGDSIMVLPSGVWFSLDQPALQRLIELIDESRDLRDPERPDVVRLHRHRVADIHDLTEIGVTDRAATRWLEAADRLVELTGIDPDGGQAAEVIAAPAGLTAELRPYQQAGYAWLSQLVDAGLGGILADDMGLGKTVQTLAAVLRLKEGGRLQEPVLVVAPTSVLPAWRSEAARFTPDLSVATVGATTRKTQQALADRVAGADIVVTSYAVARIDAAEFQRRRWSVLVLDEAQFVKNARSKTHQALRRVEAASTIVITGTPMENSLMDLWSLLALAAPGLFPRVEDFVRDYRRPIENGDDAVLARLRHRIRPLMLRRSKSVVAAELPHKQVQVVSVVMNPTHERVYQQHLQRERRRVLRLLEDDQADHRVAILASLTTLRQMALHPGLVDPGYLETMSAAKLDALLDQVQELAAEGHRALVFSSFTRFLKMAQERLHAERIDTAYLDGSTTDREAVVRDFREGSAPVFLISLKAGGFGLTLTEADYVFVLDPWWNPAAEEQAIDRVHRIGQDKAVMVYRFVSADTIEEKVLALQEHKRTLFTKVIDKGGALTGKLTAAEIRALLA